MRDLTVTEVDVGCDACAAMKATGMVDTAFVAGITLGLARDQLSFCSPHLAGFQRAMAGLNGRPAGGDAP